MIFPVSESPHGPVQTKGTNGIEHPSQALGILPFSLTLPNKYQMQTNPQHWVTRLTLPALGVVFGDIGTSPLYTLKECLRATETAPVAPLVLGVLSLIFWTLCLVVTLKYVTFILKADNEGEGGIMALLFLSLRAGGMGWRHRGILTVAGLIGAALFYGDGMITPAISVLSAIEGLELVEPEISPYIKPITLGVLIVLFMLQRHGTASVGILFGPIMLFWFLTLGAMGGIKVIENPWILDAVNPLHAGRLLIEHGAHSLTLMGAVVLAVTGAEALYADMGHFGARPIRVGWLYVVFPALVLNYFGQGAEVIAHPESMKNPFFMMFPEKFLPFVVGLATIATVIASQAVISGAFSLTQQASQLGYLPRLKILHTSETEKGQIYLPSVNFLLLIGVSVLVIAFGSSSNLAAAYGIAVTGTMLITTFLFSTVARRIWGWKRILIYPLAIFFALIDGSFLSANTLKFIEGGWLPVLIGAVIYLLISTWIEGRKLIYRRIYPQKIPLESFIEKALKDDNRQVPGTAVYLCAPDEGIPNALSQNLRHNKVLHEHIIILTIELTDHPRAHPDERFRVEPLTHPFTKVNVCHGFMELPNIPWILRLLKKHHLLPYDIGDVSYFVSRLRPTASSYPGMAIWREKLFVFMLKNAAAAPDFFRIPFEDTIELHMRIEI